jgi:hypothetical protein
LVRSRPVEGESCAGMERASAGVTHTPKKIQESEIRGSNGISERRGRTFHEPSERPSSGQHRHAYVTDWEVNSRKYY